MLNSELYQLEAPHCIILILAIIVKFYTKQIKSGRAGAIFVRGNHFNYVFPFREGELLTAAKREWMIPYQQKKLEQFLVTDNYDHTNLPSRQ